MIMDGQYSMDDALYFAENNGRATIVQRGTDISVVIEKPESPSFMFTLGNCKPGTVKFGFLPRSEKSDAVEITFRDRDLLWAENKAFAPGENYESLDRVPRITRLSMPSIKTYERASREAIFKQQFSDGIKRRITLGTGIEGLQTVMGDVVYFAHEGNSLVVHGRLAADYDGGGSIHIDQKVTLASATYSGNCKIYLKTSDDTIYEGTITGPFDEETQVFETSLTNTAERFDHYIIGRSSGEKYKYRIIAGKRKGQKTIELQGLEYDEDLYYHADYDGGATAI
jgi:hypothetical protein